MRKYVTLFIIKFQETVDLVTFIEEILNGKLHFLCSATHSTLSYTLHLLPLLLYSTNTIQKPHAALETSSPTVTIFILGLTFSRTIHFFISLCPLYPAPYVYKYRLKMLLCLQILGKWCHISLSIFHHTLFASSFCQSGFAYLVLGT